MADIDVGSHIIMVVAQRPFYWGPNRFCNLIPLARIDGAPVDKEDFPNNGLVGWKVLDVQAPFAQPGRLVSGRLEISQAFKGEPQKSRYQVDVESIEPVRARHAIEVITIPPNQISAPEQLLAGGQLYELDHPADQLMVRWRDVVYGPFQTRVVHSEEGFAATLTTATNDESVFELDPAAIEAWPARVKVRDVLVSLTQDPAWKSSDNVFQSYELLLGVTPEALGKKGIPSRVMVSDARLVKRLADELMGRKQRREIAQALDQLEKQALANPGHGVGEGRAALDRVLQAVRADISAADQIARALLESGAVDEQLNPRIEEQARKRIDQNAAKYEAELRTRMADEEHRLEELRKQNTALAERIDSEHRLARAEVEEEIRQRKEAASAEFSTREEQLRNQSRELERQQEVLRTNLEDVIQRFASAKDQVLNEFIAIAPLLERAGVFGRAARDGHAVVHHDGPTPIRQAPFVHAAYVRTGALPEALSEDAFFERFAAHVSASGFSYRRIDLISFHLSVKCCDLSVLGGISGTGKSTLPRLYSEALAGSDEAARKRYLPVAVSPSWLDVRDVLGHVNALQRQFQPSESGLYQHLINAAEEHKLRGSASGVHLVCLDEMNLAHVEHYFGTFLQVLERNDEWRTVPCFDGASVDAMSAFAKWPSIDLSPAVRFVGTVNFDETTKQLSLRLLDRVNLLRLRPSNRDALAPMAARSQPTPAVTGQCVVVRDLNAWTKDAPLEPGFAGVIDALVPHLRVLGCPLNPRRMRGICRFVASVGELCKADDAFDLQLAQRVLPQIRGVFSSAARTALDDIIRTLEDHSPRLEESIEFAHELRDQSGFA